jgi:hypothetical protein
MNMPSTKPTTAQTRARNAEILGQVRGSKTKVAKTVEQTREDPSAFERAYARYQDAQAEVLAFFNAPGWKRTLCAVVSGLAIAIGASYIGSTIVEWMLVGAVALNSSMFLAVISAILATLLTAYYGGKLAGRVAGAVLTGEADERAIAAYDAVRGFFSSIRARFAHA